MSTLPPLEGDFCRAAPGFLLGGCGVLAANFSTFSGAGFTSLGGAYK